MYVTIVYAHVKPDRVEDFISSIRADYEGTVKEPGNLRFDVLESQEDPTRFVLYEAFRSEADAKVHREMPYCVAWVALVKDWMAEPRQGIRYTGVYPQLD